MCARSAKERIHPGNAENQRRITKASVVLSPAPHVRKVGQGENTSKRRCESASHIEGVGGAVTSSTCARGPPREEYIQATLRISVAYQRRRWCCYQLHMCARSAKGRIHPGDAENQRRITKALVVVLPAPHVREVSQGENTSRRR